MILVLFVLIAVTMQWYYFVLSSITSILCIVLIGCMTWILFKNFEKKKKQWRKRPPGPTGIPLLGYLPFLGKEPWKSLSKLKEKYGDIIGLYLGPNYNVVLNEFTVAKEVLSHPAALNRAENILNAPINFGFGELNGRPWQEQRRFCFSTAKDLGLGREYWEQLVMNQALKIKSVLQQANGNPTELFPLLAFSSVSTILSLLFGRDFSTEEDKKNVELVSKYNDVTFSFFGPTYPPSVVPGLRKIYQFLRIGGNHKYADHARWFLKFLREEIAKHNNLPEYQEFHNFINTYIAKIKEATNAQKPENFFTEYTLAGNLNVILLGAADTVPITLDWLFRLMAKHPDIQERVYNELLESVGKEGTARYEERDKFPYTFAVILEAMRVGSILPLTSMRWASEDIIIKNYVIPKGSQIFANTWALHNDPKYWENPEIFSPERFLSNNGTKIITKSPSFSVFSFGKRSCPGELVAYRHITLIFSEIIRTFKIKTLSNTEPTFDVITGLVTRLKPQYLCFTKRTSNVQ